MQRTSIDDRGGRAQPFTRFRLGEYVLGETIGQGAYGKVKLATHRKTGQKVAVKIIRLEKISKSKTTTKVRREISILKSLQHPHIIRLYEVITTPTDIFMIMEYLQGGELFDYLSQNGRIRQSLARRFFQQIICGVEYMHHFRVVHRDLKPENLLMDMDENVKIADFGLSNLTTDGHFLNTSCGSPNYAAPEVILGRLYMGPEVDVWSCGVILFTMVVGRLPFDEDSIPALFSKIKEGVYTMPNSLPSLTKDLISRMLVVDPLTRMTIPEIRQNPWFLEDLPEYLATPPDSGMVEIEPDLLLLVAGQMDIPYTVAHSAITRGIKDNINAAYELLLKASKRRRSRALHIGSGAAVLDSAAVASSAPPSSGTYPTLESGSHRRISCPNAMKLRPSPVMLNFMADCSLQARESYNEPSLMAQSPSLLGSFLSASLGGSFGESSSLKDRMTALRLCSQASAPMGIPEDTVGIHSASPMSFSSDREELSLPPPSPGSGTLSAVIAQHQAAQRSHCESAESFNEFTPDVHQNWRLGLFTELPSNSAMREIYRVLRSLGCQWRVEQPYNILVSCKVPAGQAPVYIGIQLYRMQERHDRGYLVDFSILSDTILPAVDWAHHLYLLVNARLGA